VPLLLLSAFAIDVGSFYLRATELQTGSDIAALAGAEAKALGKTDDEVRQIVDEILENNGIDLTKVTVTVTIDGNNVTVAVTDGDVTQFFSQMITDDVTVGRDATATTGSCFGCEQDIQINEPIFELPEKGEGDGFVPLIVETTDPSGEYDLRMYALNHHEGSNNIVPSSQRIKQFICMSITNQTDCPGFPLRVDTNTVDESRLDYTESTGQIWYNAARPNHDTNRTVYGLGCLNTDGSNCGDGAVRGMYVLGTAPFAAKAEPENNPPRDQAEYTTTPIVHDEKVYMIDYQLRVHCFDPVSNSSCWAPKQFSEWDSIKDNAYVNNPNKWYNEYNKIEVKVSNNKLYTSWGLKGPDGNVDFRNARLACFDLETEVPCRNWANLYLGHKAPAGMIEDVDANGNQVGICLLREDSHQVRCLNENGSQRIDGGLSNVFDFRTLENGELNRDYTHRYGEKIFIGERDHPTGVTRCIDTVAKASCGQITDRSLPYGYDKIPGMDCFASLGHSDKLIFFNSDLEKCSPLRVSEPVAPCPCGGDVFRWGTLSFPPEFKAAFNKLIVTATVGDTVVAGPVDVIKTDGRLDLSGVDSSINEVILNFEFTNSPTYTWTGPIKGQVEITERATLIK